MSSGSSTHRPLGTRADAVSLAAAGDDNPVGMVAATFHADMAACWNYDDDATYEVSAAYCGPYDKEKYCDGTSGDYVVSARFDRLCAASCTSDDGETWAQVCAW